MVNRRTLLIYPFIIFTIFYSLNLIAIPSILELPECGNPKDLESIQSDTEALTETVESDESVCSAAEEPPGMAACASDTAAVTAETGVDVGKVTEQIKSCKSLKPIIEEMLEVANSVGVAKVSNCLVNNIVDGLVGSLLQDMDLKEIASIVHDSLGLLQSAINDFSIAVNSLNVAINGLETAVNTVVNTYNEEIKDKICKPILKAEHKIESVCNLMGKVLGKACELAAMATIDSLGGEAFIVPCNELPILLTAAQKTIDSLLNLLKDIVHFSSQLASWGEFIYIANICNKMTGPTGVASTCEILIQTCQ